MTCVKWLEWRGMNVFCETNVDRKNVMTLLKALTPAQQSPADLGVSSRCATLMVLETVAWSRDIITSQTVCLHRSGHPYFDGKFTNCSINRPSTPTQLSNAYLYEEIGKTFSMELNKFRSEMNTFKKELKDKYSAVLDNMNREISLLSERVIALESKPSTNCTNNDTDTGKNLCTKEEILAEHKERRSSNIILYNLVESDGPSSSSSNHH
ncbi:hypothetical protein K0M31_001852 [Melipona bicolor]|uniref:Uncharacterized protein n=1 Tax=Melipona bicolor TaxID=60889 RepID=A0AA40GGF0_9HYME|nr:hypothetical protein K0M31_001852 [Melipona bicolor]